MKFVREGDLIVQAVLNQIRGVGALSDLEHAVVEDGVVEERTNFLLQQRVEPTTPSRA